MPFTLIHPAAVLPVARSPLVPSALVMGAMAPDLPYFVSLQWIGGDYNATLTHTVTSLLWLDPLIALALLAGVHLVEQPLMALMPGSAAGRLVPIVSGFRWRSPAALRWILVSVTAGASTHLGWDALCDAFGFSWSTRLNLASDLLGGLVLLGWLWHWWRSTAPVPVPSGWTLPSRLRAVVLGAVVVVAGAWTVPRGVRNASEVGADLRRYGGWSRSAVAEHVVRAAVVDLATAVGAAVVLYALAWHLRARRAARRRPAS